MCSSGILKEIFKCSFIPFHLWWEPEVKCSKITWLRYMQTIDTKQYKIIININILQCERFALAITHTIDLDFNFSTIVHCKPSARWSTHLALIMCIAKAPLHSLLSHNYSSGEAISHRAAIRDKATWNML